MTRPELAVLLAYASDLANALLDSTLPDSRYLEQDLRGYFPHRVVERFADLVPAHPLRRELVATIVANDVVNSQGITFVTRLTAETGASAADVVSACNIARDVTGAVERWEAIEALVGRLDPALDQLMGDIDHLVEVSARWYLQHAHGQLGRAVEAHAGSFRRLGQAVPSSLPSGGCRRASARRGAWWTPACRRIGARARVPRHPLPRPERDRRRPADRSAGRDGGPRVRRRRRGDLHRLARGTPGAGADDEQVAQVGLAVWDDLRMARRRVAERVLAEPRSSSPTMPSRRSSPRAARCWSDCGGSWHLAVEEVSDLAAATVAARPDPRAWGRRNAGVG